MHRFPQKLEFIAAGLRCRKHRLARILPGEQQHFAVPAMLQHLNRQVDARKPRHHHVGDEQVRMFAARSLQRLNRVSERCCVKAALELQNHSQACGNNVVVIHDKDAELPVILNHRFALL